MTGVSSSGARVPGATCALQGALCGKASLAAFLVSMCSSGQSHASLDSSSCADHKCPKDPCLLLPPAVGTVHHGGECVGGPHSPPLTLTPHKSHTRTPCPHNCPTFMHTPQHTLCPPTHSNTSSQTHTPHHTHPLPATHYILTHTQNTSVSLYFLRILQPSLYTLNKHKS